MKLKAVIFDLDDTLYPEVQYVKSGLRAVSRWLSEQMGIASEKIFSEFWQIYEMGRSSGKRIKIFDHWLERKSIQPDKWVEQMIEIYRSHTPSIKPYPKIPDLLAKLKRSYKLGIITDGFAYSQRQKLRALQLESFFDVIIFTDEIGGRATWKPSPIPFRLALEKLEISSSSSVYIGDNPLKDFYGARSIGMWTLHIQLSEGIYHHIVPPSPAHAADFKVNTLEGLLACLAKIEEG